MKVSPRKERATSPGNVCPVSLNDRSGAWVRRWWGEVSHLVWNHHFLSVPLFHLFNSATAVNMHLGISFVSFLQWWVPLVYPGQPGTCEIPSHWHMSLNRSRAGDLCHRMFGEPHNGSECSETEPVGRLPQPWNSEDLWGQLSNSGSQPKNVLSQNPSHCYMSWIYCNVYGYWGNMEGALRALHREDLGQSGKEHKLACRRKSEIWTCQR